MDQGNLHIALERIRRWVLGSRRSPDTWFVTKAHILKPPFSVEGITENDCLLVTLSGVNDSMTVKLNNVVDSKFRAQLGIFLLDEDKVMHDFHIIAPFSRHLQIILDAFPPNSRFNTEELYSKVTWSGDPTRAQAHARRRWKELKYSYGFDLDWDGKMYWRGPSPVPVREPELRPDDNKLRKQFWAHLAQESMIKEGDQLPHCAYCGGRVISRGEENIRGTFEGIGLIDHRRPVYQGGDDSLDNLQILCQTCNNLKNSTCRRCPCNFKCSDCIWAYPEMAGARRVIIHLDQKLSDALTAKARGKSLDSVIIDILNHTMFEDSPD